MPPEPNARHTGPIPLSVSVATVEFAPAAKGCRLTFTEQVVFLDRGDTPVSRETGTNSLLDNLAAESA